MMTASDLAGGCFLPQNSKLKQRLKLIFMKDRTIIKVFLLLTLLFVGVAAQSQLINEVYPGGAFNSSATYNVDAVVLKGTANASLSGWSIQNVGPTSSASWNVTAFPSNAVFNSNGFFFLQFGSAGAFGASLPVPPFSGVSFLLHNFSLATTGGRIALVKNLTPLVGCPAGITTGTNADVFDFLGWGTSTCFEGAVEPTPATPATQSMRRTGADTNNNANDFSAVAVLPVELLDFQVQRDNETVLIYWVTAREKDNGQFVVEHSTDGKNYEELSVVKGAGTTALLQQYSIKDTNPNKGMNYYRLKQVDIDGKFEYSFIRSIKFGDHYSILLAPNPVLEGSAMALNVQSENESELTMSIFNTLGQLMLQKQISAVKGDNQLYLELSSLPKGIYALQCQSGTDLIETQQIIIK